MYTYVITQHLLNMPKELRADADVADLRLKVSHSSNHATYGRVRNQSIHACMMHISMYTYFITQHLLNMPKDADVADPRLMVSPFFESCPLMVGYATPSCGPYLGEKSATPVSRGLFATDASCLPRPL